MLRAYILVASLAICGFALAESDLGPPREIHWAWESRYHAISMPPPSMPYEARRQHLTVSGIIALDVDTAKGLVSAAKMKKSTGSKILDEAALGVTKKWRFQAGGSSHFEVPVSFGLKGGRLG